MLVDVEGSSRQPNDATPCHLRASDGGWCQVLAHSESKAGEAWHVPCWVRKGFGQDLDREKRAFTCGHPGFLHSTVLDMVDTLHIECDSRQSQSQSEQSPRSTTWRAL